MSLSKEEIYAELITSRDEDWEDPYGTCMFVIRVALDAAFERNGQMNEGEHRRLEMLRTLVGYDMLSEAQMQEHLWSMRQERDDLDRGIEEKEWDGVDEEDPE